MARYDNPPTSLTGAQETVTTTPTALNAGISVPCQEVFVVNLPSSTQTVSIGSASAQDLDLVPGGSLPIPLDDVSKVFAKTDAGTATIQWLAAS